MWEGRLGLGPLGSSWVDFGRLGTTSGDLGAVGGSCNCTPVSTHLDLLGFVGLAEAQDAVDDLAEPTVVQVAGAHRHHLVHLDRDARVHDEDGVLGRL